MKRRATYALVSLGVVGSVAMFLVTSRHGTGGKKDCRRQPNAAVRFEWSFRGKSPACPPEELAAPVIPWKIR